MSDQNQQLSKAESLILLRQTINQLERLMGQLNNDVNYTLPEQSLRQLVSDSEKLATSLQPVVVETPTIEETETPITTDDFLDTENSTEEKTQFVDKILPSFNSLQKWWDQVLKKVRVILPSPAKEDLSDWALTGIISGIIVLFLTLSVALFPNKNTPETVSITPIPVIETPTETIPSEEPINPVSSPTITPSPIIPSPLPLTPEQSLFSSIQRQISELGNENENGLIQRISADFFSSRLTVTVSDDWFSLTSSRQDQLSGEIWGRSKRLDFKKLSILDNQGNLVARSPFIGKTMIIYQRTKGV